MQAYVSNSTITAGGALTATAVASETIGALVLAPSVAIAAKSPLGIGAAGSGVVVENKVAAHARAFVDGDTAPSGGTAGISAASVALSARDTSNIVATAVATAVAASLAGSVQLAISVGVALAHNEIANVTEAYVANATSLFAANSGDITIEATSNAGISAVAAAASLSTAFASSFGGSLSGAGADATNVIRTKANAHVDDSVVRGAGDVRLTATDSSDIAATIIAASIAVGGGTTGAGASIGVTLAENVIGGAGGSSEVRAYVLRSSIDAVGALTQTADASPRIRAFVFSGAVAVAGGTTAPPAAARARAPAT